MSEFHRPRGTRDFTPEEMRIRRWAEKRMRDAIASMGYREISTPTFENTDLFVAKSGKQVLEQIYEFKDKGGRSLSLRPELTAPVMRFYQSDLRNYPKPLRISYFGSCFRYERPQKGRYREFWQMGLEYIGKRTPLALAEVVDAAVSSLEAVGLKRFEVRVGHVVLLSSILESYGAGLSKDKDLMIAIDKKDEDGIRSYIEERLESDPEDLVRLVTTTYGEEEYIEVLDKLKDDYNGIENEIDELRQVMEFLRGSSADIRLDPSISRGLDYYDGIVFEIDAPNLGAEKQICGGGAYSLSSVFGSEVEGIGFGLGFDRILVALEGEMPRSPEKGRIYLIPMGVEAERRSISLARKVRDCGLVCIVETSGRGFKKSISSAVSSGCSFLLVLGEEELKEETVSVKNLETKEQIKVPLKDLGDHLLDIAEEK
jgi:histidyl-tRNA synthetase